MPVFGAHSLAVFKDYLDCGKPLEELQLNEMDLTAIGLTGRQFNNLVVSSCLMDDADLSRCALHNSSIEGSNLRHINLSGVSMTDSGIHTSILMKGRMHGMQAVNCSFKRSHMQRLSIIQSGFKRCLFLNIEAMKSKVLETVFIECHFRFDDSGGITGFQESVFQNCLFIGCSFDGYALTGVDIAGSVFLACRFSIPDWEDVDLEGAVFSDCSALPSWKNPCQAGAQTLDAEETAQHVLQDLKDVS